MGQAGTALAAFLASLVAAAGALLPCHDDATTQVQLVKWWLVPGCCD
jgi:hypothetical protein